MEPFSAPHKDQWHGSVMFSLIWKIVWANNRDASDLGRYRAHHNVIVMVKCFPLTLEQPEVLNKLGACAFTEIIQL